MFLLTLILSLNVQASNRDVAIKNICGKMASLSNQECTVFLAKFLTDYFLESRPNDCGERKPKLKSTDEELVQIFGDPAVWPLICDLRGKACEKDIAKNVDEFFDEAQLRPTCPEKNPRSSGVRAKP